MVKQATVAVVLVSVHFTILFTAFSAFQNIVTKIHEDEGDPSLGPFTFAINYFAFMMGNFFVSRTKYSQKWIISFSTLGYVFNYSTGFFMSGKPQYVKYLLAGVGSTINGISSSFLWTNVGSYIHKVCHLYGVESEKGHYFGLFNIIFCSSNVFGALVVTFGLSLFSHDVYFAILGGIAFLAFLYSIVFIRDIKVKIDSEEGQQQKDEGFLAQVTASAKSTLSYYPRMKYTLGLIFIDGINLGVTTSTMLHLLPKEEDRQANEFNAGITLLFFGFGCVLGGYIGGKLCDKFRIRLTSLASIGFFVSACLFSIVASQIMQIWSAWLGCFLWGFTLNYFVANLMVICSRLYSGKPETFALTKQFHSFSFVIYQVVALSTKNSLPTPAIMIALLFLIGPALWGISKSPTEQSSQTQKPASESKSDQIFESPEQSLLTAKNSN